MTTIYERIKKRRKELNLSVDVVAKVLNVSRATVYRYESSDIEKLPTTILEPLSKILQTTPEHLMGWDDIQNNTSKNTNDLPLLNKKDELSIKKKLESVLNDLMPGNNALAFYDGDEPMSDEDKELLRISLENTMRLAKQMAKQKFTPNKFKK